MIDLHIDDWRTVKGFARTVDNKSGNRYKEEDWNPIRELPYSLNSQLIGNAPYIVVVDPKRKWNWNGQPVPNTEFSKKSYWQTLQASQFGVSVSKVPSYKQLEMHLGTQTAYQQSLQNNTPNEFQDMCKSIYHMGPKFTGINPSEQIGRIANAGLESMDTLYRGIEYRHPTLNMISKVTEGDYIEKMMKRNVIPFLNSNALTYVNI